MRNTPATEWLLARLTTHARAIMGDLDELSATRGRRWFWTTYARTLITLSWRAPVALVAAFVCMKFMFRMILPLFANHRSLQLMDAGLFGAYNPHIRLLSWNLSMVFAQSLFFAFPYIFARFGVRNRLTQIACALFFIAMPVYTLRPWMMDLSGVLTVLAIATALLFPLWRKSMIVLAATCGTALATVATGIFILVIVFHQNILALPPSGKWICDAIGLAIAAMVCSGLHHRLLRPRLAGGAHVEPV